MKSFRKILCTLMAVMLLLPAFSMLALATDGSGEATREITKQPTSASPTVEVSDTEGATYQWYKSELTLNEVTPENMYLYPNAPYDYNEDGWRGDTYYSPNVYLVMRLQEGEQIWIQSENSDLNFGLYNVDTVIYNYEIIDGCIVLTAEYDDIYYVMSDESSERVKIFANMYEKKAIDDQTTPTLTSFEIGTRYFVEVAYNDSDILVSNAFEMEYAITAHPSFMSPTVITNRDEDVSKYEWYFAKSTDTVYTVGTANENEVIAYVYHGIYENGKWSSQDGYFNIAVSGMPGDVLKVKTPEGFSGTVKFYDGDGFEVDENGIYYCEFTDEVDNADFEITSEVSDLEIYLERNGLKINVVEELYIDDRAMEYMISDSYGLAYDGEKWVVSSRGVVYIKAKAGSIFKVTSESELLLDIIATKNSEKVLPNEDGEYLLTSGAYIYITGENKDEFEMSLTVDGKEYKIVDKLNIINEEEKLNQVSYINDGYYKEGKWYPSGEYNEIDIELILEKGDIITVETSEEFDGSIELDVANANGLVIKLDGKDGKYIFVADKRYDLDLEIENCRVDFSAEITKQLSDSILLEGQTDKTVTPSDSGYYYVIAEMKDGTRLISGGFYTEQFAIFDVNGGTELEVFVGAELTEIGSTTREGFMLEGWYLDEALTQKATLPVAISGCVTLYAKWVICNHNASESKPSCTKSAECSLCSEELSATGHSWKNEYEKAENGHTLVCAECDAKSEEQAHTYTEWAENKAPTTKEKGSEIRACTECGYTEARDIDMLNDSISNGAIVGIIIGSGAFLALIAIGACFIIFKKKSLGA
ncbi:MAG: InlB B-repeat-containing protein [Clostridia bacterium]|nr:InlB B-repeat-containing protein [Clostridia bacterium]